MVQGKVCLYNATDLQQRPLPSAKKLQSGKQKNPIRLLVVVMATVTVTLLAKNQLEWHK